MDFAPYQSSPPENNRPFSPPLGADDSVGATSPRASYDDPNFKYNIRRPFSPQSPPPLQHPQPQRQWQQPSSFSGGGDSYQNPEAGFGGGPGGSYVSEFDTSLGIRLDHEACLAYLAVPPLGAIILLILERKSDFVRFHAWQSSLLFTVVFFIHLIFSFSSVMSWLIFIADLVGIGWLALKAYRDADTLDRYEVPIFGQIASRILDDE